MTKLRLFSKILIVLIPLLVTSEIVLRLLGFALQRPQTIQNEVQPDDDSKLRILTLGESTTADYFSESEKQAWPHVLQKQLIEAGIPTRVYNEAVGGTTSALLVGQLPGYIERYHPHIVVSMMGVNDFSTVLLDDSWTSEVQLSFFNLRLVKLSRWLMNSIQAGSSCKISFDEPDWKILGPLLYEGMNLQKTHSAGEVRELLLKKNSDVKTVARALQKISVNLAGDFKDENDYTQTQKYISLAFAMDPYQYDIAFGMMNHPTSEMCKEAIPRLLACGNNLPDALLSEIITCSGDDTKIFDHPVLQSRGLILAPRGSSPTTRHYQMMIDLLRKKKIRLVAMQYPTLDLNLLKKIISQNGSAPDYLDGVALVSNEKSFLNAVKEGKYEYVFKDRFRGSWGHTTRLGHEMIANNLFPTVLQLVQSGCCNLN